MDGRIGFLSHCGDKELVYAPVDSPEGQNCLHDMALGANMAIINHLLLNKLVCKAFEESFGPSFDADLVYHTPQNPAGNSPGRSSPP